MKLGVNIDHIATLRQARGGFYPDPLHAAQLCKRLGVNSVVMHLREDRRHMQDQDLFRVKKYAAISLNLEMSIANSVVAVAKKLRPHQVTLVPEKRRERTTEGGMDLFQKTLAIRRFTASMKSKGVRVSMFIDPDLRQVDMARRLEGDAVEFHTGDYANQNTNSGRTRELTRLTRAVTHAKKTLLHVYAGHGLNYENVISVTKIQQIEELNIGYSIVARSLWVGFEAAVKEMLELIR